MTHKTCGSKKGGAIVSYTQRLSRMHLQLLRFVNVPTGAESQHALKEAMDITSAAIKIPFIAFTIVWIWKVLNDINTLRRLQAKARDLPPPPSKSCLRSSADTETPKSVKKVRFTQETLDYEAEHRRRR